VSLFYYPSMRLLSILLLISISTLSFASIETDSLITTLNTELSKKTTYNTQKERTIQQLKEAFNRISKSNLRGRYNVCVRIYEEYKSYQFDSAYVYVKQLERLSELLEDRPKRYDTKVKLGFILLSSGMFKETFDGVKDMKVQYLADSAKIDYYSLLTRAYYDLAVYVNDNHYTPAYNRLANQYIDSAIAISQPGSYHNLYLSGYKNLKNKRYAEAEEQFRSLLGRQLTEHQYAIVASTLSHLYLLSDRQDKSIDLLIKASIADIRSNTKEAVALFWLSEVLHREGDLANAYICIQNAMADAEFYGARQRILQISTVLPIIASERLSTSETEKSRFLFVLIFITILTVVIVIFLIILYKQLQKLKIKEKIIQETKEEYIGYFFNVISAYILQLEKLKRSIDMKLTVKKYDDIGIIVNNINIKKERENLFNTFDHIFLKIFPNFINEFNALFKREDQIWPKEHEVLTTDLRIFALIRMGIEDNAVIGNILEYSEKTIYVYKMRIKAKALIHGEEFDKSIMSIRAETEK
jgi:TolA-binding protein